MYMFKIYVIVTYLKSGISNELKPRKFNTRKCVDTVWNNNRLY
jgi:hypothetical protein